MTATMQNQQFDAAFVTQSLMGQSCPMVMPTDRTAAGPTVGTVCIVAGAMIATPEGPRAVETLQPGDPVTSAETGRAVTLRATDRQFLSRHAMRLLPNMRPVRLVTGDDTGILVSPNHRVRVDTDWTAKLFGGAVMLAAKWLVATPLAHTIVPQKDLEYVQLAFDDHVMVEIDGQVIESLSQEDLEMGWVAGGPTGAADTNEDGDIRDADPKRLLEESEARTLFTLDPILQTSRSKMLAPNPI